MRNILIQDDVKLIESRLTRFEENTGCELLLIMAKESDLYPGASMRFGLLGGFLLTFIFSLFFEFHHGYLWPLTMLTLSFIMIFVGKFPWAKKLALSDIEVNRESLEKAVELFHTMGTTKVTHKVTAMIMVSLLERKIHVLVDEKLKTELTQEELDDLVSIMQRHFKEGNMALGFTQSIESLEKKILKDFQGKVSLNHASELDNKLHFL